MRGPAPGEVLEFEIGVDRGQIVAAPDHRGIRLVGLRRALREPGARSYAHRHGHEARERSGDRALDQVDDGRRIVSGREPRGNLVDRVHRGNREDSADRADHAVVDRDVALDALRAHDERWAELARIADPIA